MKVMYRITYLDLETNQRCYYCGGILFTKQEMIDEIVLLELEQKKLEEQGLQRTRGAFKKKMVLK